MKNVLFICPYTHGLGAITWIASTWHDGFEKLGYKFYVCDNIINLNSQITSLKPYICYFDIAASPIENESFRLIINNLRKTKCKIVFNVYWPMKDQKSSREKALIQYDLADIYCGERELDSMQDFIKESGKKYYTMPHSANSKYRYKPNSENKYIYDLCFIGAKLPKKVWFNNNIIKKLSKKYNIGVFGTGWNTGDNVLRGISKVARKFDLIDIAKYADKHRSRLSEEEENYIYSNSKICLNFHERELDLSQPHHIVNQRTYKIAACGGFQIVDYVKNMHKYFDETEIVSVRLNIDDWYDKIDYYLNNESERKKIQFNSYNKAHNKHISCNRVQYLETLLGFE